MTRRRPTQPTVVVPKPRPAKVTALRDPDRRLQAHMPTAPRWLKGAYADLADDIMPALKRLGALALTACSFL